MHLLISAQGMLERAGRVAAVFLAICSISACVAPQVGTQGQRRDEAQGASSPHSLTGIWIKPWNLQDKIPPGLTRAELFPPEIPPAQYTPAYEAKHKAIEANQLSAGSAQGAGAAAAHSLAVRRQASCLPYGMPRMMNWQWSLDIQQSSDHITITGEIDRELRRIWLDREQLPLDDVDLGWFGRSVGKWQGNVLVVNTIGVKEEVDGENYMAHSDEMVITERIYLYKPDVLYVDITVEDRLALREPLSYRAVWIRAPKDFEPAEYVCDNLRSRVNEEGKIIYDFKREP